MGVQIMQGRKLHGNYGSLNKFLANVLRQAVYQGGIYSNLSHTTFSRNPRESCIIEVPLY